MKALKYAQDVTRGALDSVEQIARSIQAIILEKAMAKSERSTLAANRENHKPRNYQGSNQSKEASLSGVL